MEDIQHLKEKLKTETDSLLIRRIEKQIELLEDAIVIIDHHQNMVKDNMRNKIDTLMKKYDVNETVVVEDNTVAEQLLTALSQPNIDKVYFDNSKLNITYKR